MVACEGNGAFAGAQNNFETWGEINGCTGAPGTLPDNSACQVFSTCEAGVETILCTVQNGTHCGNYNSFHIAQVAWGVIQNYSLP